MEENRVEATCTEAGSYDLVIYCETCGAELERTHHVIDPGHKPAAAVEENRVEATCTEAGSYDLVVYCTVCGEELSREHKTIEALGHDWGEWTVTTPATCTEAGSEIRTCKHDASHTETRSIDPLGHKPAAAVEENRIEATCTEAGSYDLVVYCTICDAELSRKHQTIKATGHSWGEPKYDWSADNSTVTATRTCKHDTSHEETETVNTTKSVTAPTCDEDGSITYTATFTNKAFAKQTKILPCDPATGHSWGEPAWTWKGTDEVTAKFVCSIDGTEFEAAGTITETVTEKADKHTDGSVTYTASVTGPDGKVYTTDPSDAKTETIPATHRVRKSKKDKSGSTLQVDVETDTLNVTVSGDGVTADTPALVASYDEDGRFMGLAPVTAPSKDPVEVPDEAASVKILWVDEKFTPKSESEDIVREE